MSDARSERIQAALRQEGKNIDEHFSALVIAPANDLVQLPETVFKQSFLPYFCGEKSIDDGSNILATWIGIAGSPMKEVLVVNDAGQPLFRVPPMSDTGIIDPTNIKKGRPFREILTLYGLKMHQTPMAAENYLASELPNRLEALRANSVTFSDNETRWHEIFARYGKVPPIVDVEKEKKEAAKKISDDEVSFGGNEDF